MCAWNTVLAQYSLVAFAVGLLMLLQPTTLFTSSANDMAYVNGNATLTCGVLECWVVRGAKKVFVDSVDVAGASCGRRGDWMWGARSVCFLLVAVFLPAAYASHLLQAMYPLPQHGRLEKVVAFARGRAKYIHIAASVAALMLGGCMLMLYRSDFCDTSLRKEGMYSTSAGFGGSAAFTLSVTEVCAFICCLIETQRGGDASGCRGDGAGSDTASTAGTTTPRRGSRGSGSRRSNSATTVVSFTEVVVADAGKVPGVAALSGSEAGTPAPAVATVVTGSLGEHGGVVPASMGAPINASFTGDAYRPTPAPASLSLSSGITSPKPISIFADDGVVGTVGTSGSAMSVGSDGRPLKSALRAGGGRKTGDRDKDPATQEQRESAGERTPLI